MAAGQPTVTYPNGGESLPQNTLISITWTVEPVSVGTFEIYIRNSASTQWGIANSITPIPGQTNYSYSWMVPFTQSPATDYKIRIWYRNAGGSWLYYDDSNATFTITYVTPPQPTITNPNTGGNFILRSIIPVSWTIPAAVATGNFSTYARNAIGTLYIIDIQNAVDGQTTYSFNWTVTQPVGAGYVILVWYRDAATSWLYSDVSDVVFSITTAAFFFRNFVTRRVA